MPDVVEVASEMPQNEENKESENTGEKEIENIDVILRDTQDLIDRIDDTELRNNLRKSYKNIGKNCDLISKKLATTELRKLDLEATIESNRNAMLMEQSRNRANILSQYLQKDLVATTVGAVLLTILVIAYAMAMFLGVSSPDILNNAFLLILGYFFGQTASKSTSVQKPV